MAETCLTAQECYDCSNYKSAFACLKKMKISDMTAATDLEIQEINDSECDELVIPAVKKNCAGDSENRSVTLSQLSGGSGPIGMTFWSPVDFGENYNGCWYKFNEDLVITKTDFPDFFDAAGITAETFTIPGMEGKFAMGAAAGGYTVVGGNASNETSLTCENLPSCPINITDPGHTHTVTFPIQSDHEKSSGRTSYSPANPEATPSLPCSTATTGITAEMEVGDGGSGNPIAINVQPWNVGGAFYIKLSNNCE